MEGQKHAGEGPTLVRDSYEKVFGTMDNRDDDRAEMDVLRTVFCDGSMRRVLDELKEHIPTERSDGVMEKTHEKDALEMPRDVRERRIELAFQHDQYRSLWSSSLFEQARTLPHHISSIQPRIDHPDSPLLVVRRALSFPLSFAELLRQGNVLLRDDASRDARAEHASHEGVETLGREDDGGGFGHPAKRRINFFPRKLRSPSSTHPIASCINIVSYALKSTRGNAYLGNHDLVAIQSVLHKLAEPVVVLQRVDDGVLSYPACGCSVLLSKRSTKYAPLEGFQVHVIDMLESRMGDDDEGERLQVSQTVGEPRW